MNKRQKKKSLKKFYAEIESGVDGYRNIRKKNKKWHEWCVKIDRKYKNGIQWRNKDEEDGLQKMQER